MDTESRLGIEIKSRLGNTKNRHGGFKTIASPLLSVTESPRLYSHSHIHDLDPASLESSEPMS